MVMSRGRAVPASARSIGLCLCAQTRMTHGNRCAFPISQAPIRELEPRITEWLPLCVCNMGRQSGSNLIDEYSHHGSLVVERELQRTARYNSRGLPARRLRSPGGDEESITQGRTRAGFYRQTAMKHAARKAQPRKRRARTPLDSSRGVRVQL